MMFRKRFVGCILLTAFFFFLNQADTFSYPSFQADAHALIKHAATFNIPEQADSALIYLNKACPILKEANDLNGYLSCIDKRGDVYYRMGRYADARDEYIELLELTEEWFGKKNGWYTTGLIRSGMVNRELGNFEIGISYLLEAQALRKNHYSDSDSIYAVISYAIGATLHDQGNYREALEYYYESLELRHTIFGEKHIDIANSYAGIGTTYLNTGKHSDALRYEQKALSIREKLLPPDHFDLSRSYLSLGVIYGEIGDYIQSIEYSRKALDIRIVHLGEYHPDIARVYNNIANTLHRIGRDKEAIEFHHKAIDIRRNLLGENHLQIAISYNNLADIFRQNRDYELATQYFKRAIAIGRSALGEDHPFVGAFTNNLGLTYEQMGEFENAIEYYKEAVDITLRTLDEVHPNIAIFYNNIGNVYRQQRDYHNSIEYHRRALTIRYELLPPDHPDIAQSYYNFGINYQHLREYEKALDYLNRSLVIRLETLGRHNQVTAATFYDIGLVYRDMGEHLTSLEYHQYAIQCLAPSFTDSSIFANPELDDLIYEGYLVEMLTSKGHTLHLLYNETQNNEYLDLAFETVMLSSQLVDNIRGGYASDTSKLLLASRSHSLYEHAIGISLALHRHTGRQRFIREAFLFAEKARASVLWESVLDAHALSFSGIPDTLIALEEKLRSDLAYYELELHKAGVNNSLADGYRKIFLNLRSEYNTLMETIKVAYPDFYDLRYSVSAFDPENIFSLLDENTAFVQYFMGNENGYAFVITDETISAHFTGHMSDIRRSSRNFNTSLRRFNNTGYVTEAHRLYEFLIEPIAPEIASKEKLIIIPDGILHYVPFEALITSHPSDADRPIRFAELDYLINQFEITYHYSARLFSHNVKKMQQHERTFAFAGFAPVKFESDGENLLLASDIDRGRDTNEFGENIRELEIDGLWFDPLPYSQSEIDNIISLFQSRRLPATGFIHDDATADNFKRHAHEYSILHIASHAFIDETNPHLSGIVFAYEQTDDRAGLGIIYPGEIYTLKLNADLVVLSSCESGIGEFVRGEGIMAMTRGLMYAGASNIVVSLWKVYDRQTKELMINFYSHLLEGNTYSASLRNTKLRMLSNEATAFPQFWSGFILLGS